MGTKTKSTGTCGYGRNFYNCADTYATDTLEEKLRDLDLDYLTIQSTILCRNTYLFQNFTYLFQNFTINQLFE